MENITSIMLKKLGKMENFTLRYAGGREILWDINAPGLHVLLNAERFMLSAGERGHQSLLHHSIHGDFFRAACSILQKAGITAAHAPRVWVYIRELQKYAERQNDPEIKANTNIQLFIFIQSFLEGLLYTSYVDTTGKTVRLHKDVFVKLLVAADSFIFREKGGVQMAAGYPWFTDTWCRDTFISLPGLFITTGRYHEAKELFRFFAARQREDGMLPTLVTRDGRKVYACADSSLWFVEALNRYFNRADDEDKGSFIREMLPAVNRIIDGYVNRQGSVFLDQDNLLVVPSRWTWMDAAINGRAVTPRFGKPVEMQALLYNALGIADRFNRAVGGSPAAATYGKLREAMSDAINSRYFLDAGGYPPDVLDGDPHGAAVRPHPLLLISLSDGFDLLSRDKKETILAVIEQRLLTPYGVRTLAPDDPRYFGWYDTFAPLEIKDRAYHQGTAWPWLLAQYAAAKMYATPGVHGEEFAAALTVTAGSLMSFVREHNTLPELFCGDVPHRPGGAVSQAWSVGALLEIIEMINTLSEPVRPGKPAATC